MKTVCFRVDASTQIGTGHVMRCLTLADALQLKNIKAIFISRELEGNLNELIEQRGYKVHQLQFSDTTTASATIRLTSKLHHADWLPVTQLEDAHDCIPIINKIMPNWLIIDHYSLDYIWQDQVKQFCKKIMVIDDLADRKHLCNILLDQTYNRELDRYKPLVPKQCNILTGSRYSLLRPEFTHYREASLKRRVAGNLKQILITMGGIDKDNYTGKILAQLLPVIFFHNLKVVIIMGGQSPSIPEVQQQISGIKGEIDLKVDVNNMAEIMAESDLAIGSAGSTSWERCCLGLPSLMYILADNQREIAKSLEQSGAAKIITFDQQLSELLLDLISQPLSLKNMSNASKLVTNGSGTNSVLEEILKDL